MVEKGRELTCAHFVPQPRSDRTNASNSGRFSRRNQKWSLGRRERGSLPENQSDEMFEILSQHLRNTFATSLSSLHTLNRIARQAHFARLVSQAFTFQDFNSNTIHPQCTCILRTPHLIKSSRFHNCHLSGSKVVIFSALHYVFRQTLTCFVRPSISN